MNFGLLSRLLTILAARERFRHAAHDHACRIGVLSVTRHQATCSVGVGWPRLQARPEVLHSKATSGHTWRRAGGGGLRERRSAHGLGVQNLRVSKRALSAGGSVIWGAKHMFYV